MSMLLPRHNYELAQLILSGTLLKQAVVPMGEAEAMAMQAAGADPAAGGAVDPAAAAAAGAPGDPATLAASGAMPPGPGMDAAMAAMAPAVPPAGGAAPMPGAAGGADPAMVASLAEALKQVGIGQGGQPQGFEEWVVGALQQIANAAGIQLPPAPSLQSEPAPKRSK